MTDRLFLVATLAGRSVAIPSDAIESVIVLGAIVPVPAAPSHIVGLTALRSKVVTVVDAAARLGVPGEGRISERAIVAAVDGHVYAVMVDGVEDVAMLATRPLANGVNVGEAWATVASDIAVRNGVPLLILDLPTLIRGGAAPRLAA